MILFPTDEKTKLIRNMQKTEQDYERIAQCFNSFKDSDSWPGGFGGSFIFTKEWAEDNYKAMDMNSFFVADAPDDKNKMVGVCICNKSWDLPDGWYVAILGVDPAYQRQKIGKALLLKGTQFAVERNARFIGLHTWGGNLKAMPLYKRQGYKWRPRTSVYMENYIPQILSFPLFKEFFSQNSWYDVFKPLINQEQDDELDDEMLIYKYYFETEEGESLKVWIDRTIGKISGFHFKYKELNLLIKASTPNSQSFIGIEEFPFELQLKNDSEENVKISISASSTSNIEFTGKKKISLDLSSNSKEVLNYTGYFLQGTDELDITVFTQTYSLNEIEFEISVDNIIIPITLGKVPKNAVDIQVNPKNFVSKPNSEVVLPLVISNFMGESKEVIIKIVGSELLSFGREVIQTKVSKYDTQIEIPLSIKACDTTVDYFEVKAFSSDNTEIISKKLPIVIFRKNKAISYEIGQQVFIENRDIRLSYYNTCTIGENLVTIRDKKRNLERIGFTMILGYPFDTEGNEFFTKNLEHILNSNEEGIWLHSSFLSDEKKGIKFTRNMFVPNGDEPIGVSFTLENISEKEMDNLGINTEFWWWRGPSAEQSIFHLNEGIIHYNFPELPIEPPNKPEDFKEGWSAGRYPEGYIGCLFDLSKLDKIKFGQAEEKIPKLSPNISYESSMLWFYFSDTWQEIRLKWMEKFLNPVERKLALWESPSNYKTMGLYSDSSHQYLSRGIILPKSKNSFVLSINAQKETCFEGNIIMYFPDLQTTPKEYKIEKTKASNLNIKFEFEKLRYRIYAGKITFKTPSIQYGYPIALSCFDEDREVNIIEKEKNQIYSVDNGFLQFSADSKFRGELFHLSVGGSQNYLITFHPEVKPFLWWNEFYGGLGGYIFDYHDRDEHNYNRLNFTGSIIQKGLWKGLSFKSEIIEYSSKLKGLQITNNYLTLPDSPFILFQQIIENHAETPRIFSILSDARLKTSGKPEDEYYTEINGKIVTFNMCDYQGYINRHQDNHVKWCAYRNTENDYNLGIVTFSNQKYIHTGIYTPNLSYALIGGDSMNNTINPKEKFIFNTLYVLTKNLESIRPFTQTNFEEYF